MNTVNQRSFFCFLLVGGSATILHYLIMGGLMLLTNITAINASASGYILSTFYNYLANSHFTFGGVHNHRRSFLRFIITALTGLVINQIILLIGIYLMVPIFLSQLTATIAVFFWNYFVNATWTFAK